ncbi:hypothetical protein SGLAD_v1c07500 [Spiroplasma gladiatoris]|uniref:Uncharacterized protein n=1 Tax=Spiroplasma gladiatoris TaxID=2143 RepID=A0A4V1AQB8_9MOLU|nr:hypothetical protein [Spiroplasma gladiatoris]QBQ07949.1 hypothetical protein SGLAD_v1c07500 [Spiroplasma gladiatoris]
MKKIIYEIVFITLMTFLYYIYSAWIDNSKNTNSTVYEIFSPFKLIILGSIFTIVYGAVKTILFYNIKNLSDYKKNLRNNILFEFESVLDYINNLKNSIEEKDLNKIKYFVKYYANIKYRPVYLNLLLDELTSRLLSEHDYSDLIQSCNLISESIRTIYNKEKDRLGYKKSENLFELRRVNEYYNKNSWIVISFYMTLFNRDTHCEEYVVNKWKVTSLYVMRFSYFLYPAFFLSLFLFAAIGFGLYSLNVTLNRYFYASFSLSVFFISSLFYIINLIYNSKKHHIKIFWPQLITYFAFIFIIFLDMFLNVIFSPIMKSSNDWYESDLITFLCYLVYIILSAMLLSYIFSSILELFEHRTFNILNLIFNIIIPVILFVVSFTLNYFSITNTESNQTYLINFSVIFVYWILSVFSSKFINK